MDIQWALVIFTAVGGAGAVCFSCLCLDEFLGLFNNKKAIYVTCIVCAALLILSALISMTHIIHHLTRVLAVFAHPAKGIFLEALLIGIDCIFIGLYFVLKLRNIGSMPQRIIAACGIVMGFAFPFFCGDSYMMESQFTWDTYALPIGYLGTAWPAGVSVWLLINYLFKAEDAAIAFCGKLLIGASVFSLATALSYGLVFGGTGNDHPLLFWGCIIGLDGIVALIGGLAVLSKKLPAKFTVALGAFLVVCTFVGANSYRVLMWVGADIVMNLFGVSLD